MAEILDDYAMKTSLDPSSGKPVQHVVATSLGSTLAESKTQANAVGGVVTFSETINTLEIYNTDPTNNGVFVVNGIAVTIPKNIPFKASFGGIPGTTVTVTGATSYILNRYE